VRLDLDVADFPKVATLFRQEKPGVILHCAALRQSPDCQANPALAQKLNVDVTRHLCELARDIPFIFFSSDLVFDGRTGDYDETSPVNPLSVYAQTKVRRRIVRSLQSPTHCNPHFPERRNLTLRRSRFQ